MKLYAVQEKRYTSSYNGGTDIILYLKGIFKDIKNAEDYLKNNKFCRASIYEIETDL